MNKLAHKVFKIFRRKNVNFCAGYQILTDQELIVEYLQGRVNLKGLKVYKQLQFEDPLFNPSYTIISDTRECTFSDMFSQINQYINFLHEYRVKLEVKRISLTLTRNNNQLAYLKFFKDRQNNSLLQELYLYHDLASGLSFLGKEDLELKINEVFDDIKKHKLIEYIE